MNGFQAQETGAPRCGGAREIPMSCCMCEHVETAQSLDDDTHGHGCTDHTHEARTGQDRTGQDKRHVSRTFELARVHICFQPYHLQGNDHRKSGCRFFSKNKNRNVRNLMLDFSLNYLIP